MSNTERLEINPNQIYDDIDNSQEQLAKEGIDINKDVVTSKDGTTATVSTPDTQPMSSETRPSWLPEKFTSAEEMAKAYSEIEKKQSQRQQEDNQETEQTENEQTDGEEVQEVGLEKFYTEFDEKGELSDDSYNELEDMGLPRDLVNSYIDGQKAIADQHINSVHQTVGGKDNYEALIGWASENLSQEEKEAFNHTVDYGSVQQLNMALQGLMSRANVSPLSPQPQQQELFEGQPINYGSDAPYQSIAEMTTDMNNPKYENDPAYRDMVERRLSKSNIL